jgi:hypothetical protein
LIKLEEGFTELASQSMELASQFTELASPSIELVSQSKELASHPWNSHPDP